MTTIEKTTQLLNNIDKQWDDDQYPLVVKKLYEQAIELYWELLDKSLPAVVSVILYRTLFEQLVTILFILSDKNEMNHRAILFDNSAQLRLKLRLKQSYSQTEVLKESDTLSTFFNDYPYHGVIEQLNYDIRRHEQAFDEIAKNYMSESSIQQDVRRRRWYRMEPGVYKNVTTRVENLRDIAEYLLGDIGNDMYNAIYSFASHINHGHWLESTEHLDHLMKAMRLPDMINDILTEILQVMKGNKIQLFSHQYKLVSSDIQSWFPNEQQLNSMTNNPQFKSVISHRLSQQIETMLQTASYFYEHHHVRFATLVLRPALEMMKHWLNYQEGASWVKYYLENQKSFLQWLNKLAYQPATNHLEPLNQYLEKWKEAHTHSRHSHSPSSSQVMYKKKFLDEVTNGLFSVYAHGIDLDNHIYYDDVPLPGTSQNLEGLIVESMEAIKLNMAMVTEEEVE